MAHYICPDCGHESWYNGDDCHCGQVECSRCDEWFYPDNAVNLIDDEYMCDDCINKAKENGKDVGL